jgi:hypothetical protein
VLSPSSNTYCVETPPAAAAAAATAAAAGRVASLVSAATTTSPGRRGALSDALPRWAPPAAASAAIAAATWAVFSRAFLNYDTLYALLWGRDLAHGRVPDFEFTLAPTPHPLATAVGALASLFGTDGGYTVMLALGLLSFGVLLWAVFRLGQVAFAWPVGLLAALIVATRVPFLSQGVRAYVDIPFLALVVLAAVLEVDRPRRGWAVLGLLALAGLLRPEAWLVAAAYWIYLAPALDRGRRLGALALVAAAPLLWAVSDLLVTGDPFHSLTGTRDTAETLNRPRGIGEVPETMARRLGEILRLPALVGGTAGFFAALYLARERWKAGMAAVPQTMMVPIALTLLGGLAFVALGIAGLPLIGRYLFLPAAMLAIFFGFAALGWLGIEDGAVRRHRIIAGAVLLASFAAFAPANVRGLDGMRDGVQLRGKIEDDLRELTRSPQQRALFERCSPIYVPNHRLVPILAWQLDRDAEEIVSAQLERPLRGIFVAPANSVVEEKFVLDPNDPKRLEAEVPSDFKRVDPETPPIESWDVYRKGC